MKKLLFAGLAILSFNVFSQSYVVMENGLVLTTDSSGFAYDFGHSAFPQKVTLKGGQYFVEEGNILATVDENGLLFRKYEVIPEKIKGKGINYFLSDEGFLYTIDRKGFVKFTESELYKKALNFGGNYFTVSTDSDKPLDFYVITADGVAVKAQTPSLKLKDIVSFGGTYFMTNRGVVFTVGNDGTISARDEMRVGIIQKRGGNYFTDSSNYFYTVSEAGDIQMPALPMSLKVSAILKLGSNYFIDSTGKFYVVDKHGQVFERMMRDQDFKTAKIISL